MKKTLWMYAGLIFLSACSSGSKIPDGDSQYLPFAPDGIPFVVADSLWQADMQGNHRAVVEVKESDNPKAVQVYLPWRRPDLRPETKKIVVVDATSNANVKNVWVNRLTAESGTITFEPTSGNGIYYVYYLPYQFRKGWNDARYGNPWNDYLPPVYETDESWKNSLPKEIPQAKVLRFESRSRFDAFTPMGLTATQREMDSLKRCYPTNPLLFPEDRAFPIRLTNALPARWIKNGPGNSFKGAALRNEYYTWQIGVWATDNDINQVHLDFTDLINGNDTIYGKDITCFNLEGINWDGSPMTFTVNVPKGKVQALWCGVQIPEDARPGTYRGQITWSAQNQKAQNIPIEIQVGREILADKGDNDLWRHARLRWLNSTIGSDLNPVKPYTAMQLNGTTITATDKTLEVAPNGLPASIRINEKEVLAAPFRFLVTTGKGTISFDATNTTLRKEADGLITWQASYSQEGIHFESNASMEYDGYVHYNIKLSSDKTLPVKDIRLETRYTPYASTYFMGTGFSGGYRPVNHQWNWNGPWDSYWMGNTKAGLHVEYRGGSYHGPLLNDYKPAPPRAWANNGKGSIQVSGPKGSQACVVASTGADTLSGDPRSYEFDLLITPVKPVNPSKHFSERYYHAPHTGFDKAAEEGANIVNIHHAQKLNPVINYPFIVQDSLKAFIRHEHEFGRKVKLYYTIRELTNYTTEIYALKSLNHEIFVSGVGYGLPWHCEHLIDDYRPAWYTELPNETSDAALVLSGFSRWINYYLEGLRWMFENYDLDGIYMDDVSFDRPVMKRMRKIMEQYHPGALIDLHSNTGYSIGPANQYTGFFPYVNRLWFGESFRYNQMKPDEWLVTFSGIPFGQMSEMLQDGGNRFLGMVYGATARHSYGQYSPAPVWKLWQSFGIEEAEMLGYWDEKCPVRTSDPEVKATAYVKPDKVLVAIGNFSDQDKTIQLSFDWKALGFDPDQTVLSAPAVTDFQEAHTFQKDEHIFVKSKEGWLLILEKK